MSKPNIPAALEDFTYLLSIYAMERTSVKDWEKPVDGTPRMGHAHSVLDTLQDWQKNKVFHDKFVANLRTSLVGVQTYY